MDIEHKLFAIHLMKRLAMADQTFQMSEQAFVDLAARHLEVAQEIVDNIDPETYEITCMPAHEQDRMTILYYLLFLSEIDGVMLDEEKKEIRKIGFELGFRDDQIVRMINIVDNNKSRRLDPDHLINAIRTTLN